MSRQDRPVCSICSRIHNPDRPCPQRVANAIMQLPKSMEQLTDSDKAWMSKHSINVLELLEDHIAEIM